MKREGEADVRGGRGKVEARTEGLVRLPYCRNFFEGCR